MRDRIVVRPQGLYKELEQPPDARARLRRRLGIDDDSRIVLNVGFGDLRKGIDTFVARRKARGRAGRRPALRLGREPSPRRRALVQCRRRRRVRGRIHFVPYTDDVAEFYFGADAFFLSSREDPFPSVVLEAMAAGLPVVGFVGASGTEELIAEHGRLVDRDDLAGVVVALDEAAREDDERARAARARVVAEQFRFDDYCFDLLRFLDPDLEKVSVVVPNYNYARLPRRTGCARSSTRRIPSSRRSSSTTRSTDDSLARLDEIATASRSPLPCRRQ